jgi:hypothetical protein
MTEIVSERAQDTGRCPPLEPHEKPCVSGETCFCWRHTADSTLEHLVIDSGWEGFCESRRCSRDTYPESYITEYIVIYEHYPASWSHGPPTGLIRKRTPQPSSHLPGRGLRGAAENRQPAIHRGYSDIRSHNARKVVIGS